jgi:release factor glutamine methyltransferase
MTTITALIDSATKLLEQAGVSSPRVDAELLLAHTLGVERSQLLTVSSATAEQEFDFEALVARRANRVPLQHLTGVAHFRHLSLAVGPGVFVPRPETELLVETAIAHLKTFSGPKLAADLCAGSGAIALSLALEVPETTVHAVELSDDAIKWLTHNVIDHAAQLEAAGSHVIVHRGNAGDRDLLTKFAGKFSAVVSNPPYIPNAMIPRDPEARDHDPAIALFSGDDGLDAAREIVLVASDALAPGGFFGMEHADVQGESVPSLLKEMSGLWSQVKDNNDYNDLPRFTTALRTQAPVIPQNTGG